MRTRVACCKARPHLGGLGVDCDEVTLQRVREQEVGAAAAAADAAATADADASAATSATAAAAKATPKWSSVASICLAASDSSDGSALHLAMRHTAQDTVQGASGVLSGSFRVSGGRLSDRRASAKPTPTEVSSR